MTEPRGHHLFDLADALRPYKYEPLVIVETGCLRGTSEDYRMGDGHSTLYLTKFAKEYGASFTSIEISPSAIATASAYLEQNSLESWMNFIQGDSVKVLSEWAGNIDLAFLDGGPDQILNLTEFWLVYGHIRKPGFVVIDDCFGLLDSETKGRLAMESVTRIGLAPIFRLDRMAVIPFGTKAEEIAAKAQNNVL
jgi:Methyltransferase domain